MGTIPNSSLPFNDNAVNGDNVDYNAWNQAMQVIQLAVNDNQSQINAIKNAQTTILVAHGVAYPTNPAPSAGQLFYRDDLSQLKMFNGTLWEDVESVVATANGLSINGVAYNISTSAIANTIALRDATGSITAQSFHGNADTATSATNANNLAVGGSNLAGSTSATANTIAVRDASGNLTAGTFNGALNGNASTATSATSANHANTLGGTFEVEVSTLFSGAYPEIYITGNYANPTNPQGSAGITVHSASSSGSSPNLPSPIINIVSSNATYSFEAQLSAQASSTAYAGLWDITANALVTNSTVSTTNTNFVTVRSSSISLITGHQYAMTTWLSGTAPSTVCNARIVGQV